MVNARARAAWVVLACLGMLQVAQAVEWSGKVPSDRERGEQLYARHCVACHGDRVAGDGPLAASLVAPVPDLSDGIDPSRMEALVRVVMRGKGAMPSFEQSFRDIRPHDDDWKRFPRAVLDHMDRLARHGPTVRPKDDAPEEAADDEEDEGDVEAQAPPQ